MAYNQHDLGDLVVVNAEFTNAELGGVLDPDVVKLSVRKPDDSVTTYTYGVDAIVVRDDVGQYHADLDVDQSGIWFYRWWSTGDGQGARERQFEVLPARAVENESE